MAASCEEHVAEESAGLTRRKGISGRTKMVSRGGDIQLGFERMRVGNFRQIGAPCGNQKQEGAKHVCAGMATSSTARAGILSGRND